MKTILISTTAPQNFSIWRKTIIIIFVVVLNNVTRLDDFWKFLVTNFLTKEAKIFSNLSGYFERQHCLSKNCCGYFLGNFWKYLGYFVLRNLVTLVQKHNERERERERVSNFFIVLWLSIPGNNGSSVPESRQQLDLPLSFLSFSLSLGPIYKLGKSN